MAHISFLVHNREHYMIVKTSAKHTWFFHVEHEYEQRSPFAEIQVMSKFSKRTFVNTITVCTIVSLAKFISIY